MSVQDCKERAGIKKGLELGRIIPGGLGLVGWAWWVGPGGLGLVGWAWWVG